MTIASSGNEACDLFLDRNLYNPNADQKETTQDTLRLEGGKQARSDDTLNTALSSFPLASNHNNLI
jgi:hypothetical protein